MSLEKDPHSKDNPASIFRTIHTPKGTSGFLGFSKLEAVAHVGEDLVGKMRGGVLTINPETASAFLATAAAVRFMLGQIKLSHGTESGAAPANIVAVQADGHPFGLVVGRINDTVQETITAKRQAHAHGVFGSVATHDRVTHLLAVKAVVRAADPSFCPGLPVAQGAARPRSGDAGVPGLVEQGRTGGTSGRARSALQWRLLPEVASRTF